MADPRYMVNSSQVRYEKRLYWVSDSATGETYGASNKRQAEQIAKRLNKTKRKTSKS